MAQPLPAMRGHPVPWPAPQPYLPQRRHLARMNEPLPQAHLAHLTGCLPIGHSGFQWRRPCWPCPSAVASWPASSRRGLACCDGRASGPRPAATAAVSQVITGNPQQEASLPGHTRIAPITAAPGCHRRSKAGPTLESGHVAQLCLPAWTLSCMSMWPALLSACLHVQARSAKQSHVLMLERDKRKPRRGGWGMRSGGSAVAHGLVACPLPRRTPHSPLGALVHPR